MSRTIKRFRGGYVIETDDGYRVFVKFVERRKHFMRRNRSWAISLQIVQELNKLEVDSIELHITDEQQVIVVDMSVFNAKSTIERYPPFEEQAFLHEGYWAVMG